MSQVDLESIRLVLVCGMSGAGKTSFINKATGAALVVGHSEQSETSEITVEGIPLIELDGVYVQLVDVPGFDDTRDASDTEIYLQLVAWLSERYPGSKRVSGLIYMRPITTPKVSKLESSFIGMFKALVGEDQLDHVMLVTNRWNSPPDIGNEYLEMKMSTDANYFGTYAGKKVRTGRLVGKYTQEEAQRILSPFRDLQPFTLEIQRETIEEKIHPLEATAGKKNNAYINGRVPGLMERAEKAVKEANELKKHLEDAEKRAKLSQGVAEKSATGSEAFEDDGHLVKAFFAAMLAFFGGVTRNQALAAAGEMLADR